MYGCESDDAKVNCADSTASWAEGTANDARLSGARERQAIKSEGWSPRCVQVSRERSRAIESRERAMRRLRTRLVALGRPLELGP